MSEAVSYATKTAEGGWRVTGTRVSLDSVVRAYWDGVTGRVRRVLIGHGSWVGTAVFSPDGALLASGSRDNTVRIWRAADGAAVTPGASGP